MLGFARSLGAATLMVVAAACSPDPARLLTDKTATETTEQGIASLLDKGRRILPDLLNEEVTATYSGLRAST